MKKLNSRQLRHLIMQEIKNPVSQRSRKSMLEKKKSSLFSQAMLKEEFAAVDTGTNIADLSGEDAYEQLTSGDESAPLIKAMMSATGWASGAIGKAGGVEAIKDWAESVGKGELTSRISKVGSALPASGLAKKDMPALEGEDASDVKDALSPGGRFNVDIEADYAGGEESVDAWLKGLPKEDQEKLGSGKEPAVKKESFLREDKFPSPGTISGGGKDPVGQALAFLVKGKHDGNQTDDNIEVQVAGTIGNSEMIPTQSNILAAKSLLFAFLQGTGNSDLSDMGGAFVTSAGEILDGHHRWSGAFIGTGGGLSHSNVHIVDGSAKELLPALTAIGNAIGRTQKESKNSSDDLVMEHWRHLAGI